MVLVQSSPDYCMYSIFVSETTTMLFIYPIAIKKTKTPYNFGHSEYNGVNQSTELQGVSKKRGPFLKLV